jgi:diadenosine tetraphosphatase ApaH/serine/threonine PP2A family protein phosphatase
MKYAVLSCIHGNLAALEAVLADIDIQKADRIYCVGDLVGYGPYPNEVVARIRELEIPTCRGCWDDDTVEGVNSCECSYPSLLAEQRGFVAHQWTNQEVSDETRDFLAQLPHSLRVDELCFVHGSPHSAHEYLLPETDAFMAVERVSSTGARVLFCGHTHVPYVRTLESSLVQVKINGTTESFASPALRIINVGSVGEPRHGRPNATYVIYDAETGEVSLREVAYDYQKTCEAILQKGLPAIFAWRLSQGMEFAERAEDASHVCAR